MFFFFIFQANHQTTMGNQLSTDTLCSTDSDGHSYWVGIDWKSFAKGNRKKCYQGCLNGLGPRSGETVVVKAFRNQLRSQEAWQNEELKGQSANLFLDMFNSQYPGRWDIKINVPIVALMDSVSKINDILGYRSRSRSLNDNEWVGIEEHIPGKFTRFCVTNTEGEYERGILLEAFSHFTYHQSRGALVICDFQGVQHGGSYHVTIPVIHSQNEEFGRTDLGAHGINEFFKTHRCNDLCKKWSRMHPLSPPPSFENIYEPPPFRAIPSAPPVDCDG